MKKHLAITVSRQGASFVYLRDSRIDQEEFVIFHAFNAESVKDILKETVSNTAFLSQEFDEVTLAWSSDKSTLVPNAIFTESDAQSIFQLCFGDNINKTEIDYNRIWEAGVVNVFEIPTWIKSFFIIKYPRIILQHLGTHALRSALDNNAFYLKVTLIISEGYFYLSMIKHNQVQFYSFFDSQSVEDVIYHLVFALQQKEFTEEKGSIELVAGNGQTEEHLNEIKSGLEKIKDLSGFNVTLAADFIPKAQQLCV
ncbi:MAG: DUF3822 family protein [Crocinitomicaceae bacterium]|nr:DUF3822 family protein [Crocinitomicaceae bacterium]